MPVPGKMFAMNIGFASFKINCTKQDRCSNGANIARLIVWSRAEGHVIDDALQSRLIAYPITFLPG